MDDLDYMRLALNLAQRGAGHVSPNPLVGAVLVRDGRIIGQGWHTHCGGLHAERHALQNCIENPHGATLYVTLEPCCHHGRQPPCTDAILQSGIARVVIGARDPNPLVCGRGVELLRKHGIAVEEPVLEDACTRLNDVFFHYIRTKTPYVILKYAMTMDGKIATRTGASRWITSEHARRNVHADRHRYAAVMVGVGTVLADDPLLTCRIVGGISPLRIVCDTHLRTPLTAQVVTTAHDTPTLFATCCTDAEHLAPYHTAGCHTCILPRDTNGKMDLHALMQALGTEGVDSILLEGGGALNWSALAAGLVHKVQAYIAPKLFGGEALSPISGFGVAAPEAAIRLKNTTITSLGPDFLLESEVDYPCLQD